MASHIFVRNLSVASVLVLLLPCTAFADFDSGSDGSDGAFAPEFDRIVDLSLAATASWDTPSPVPGQGVYDPEKWAVVFKYTTIDIPLGVTVTFKNHPSRAPVYWLAVGNVDVSGTVSVSGKAGAGSAEPMGYAEPGPGGFAGAKRGDSEAPSSQGFGPGGSSGSDDGQYANSYGSPRIIPLIGGSGSGTYGTHGGGAGGGAILLASSTEILLGFTGAISANGGNRGGNSAGGGSGGAVRLIADSIAGDGILRALGGYGASAKGRIRVDAEVIDLSDPGDPPWTTELTAFPVFPPANEPILRITDIDGLAPPEFPDSGLPTTDMEMDNGNPVVVNIEAFLIPSGTTVGVRVVPASGTPFVVTSTPLTFDKAGVLRATAIVTFPSGKSEVQLRANWE